VVAAMRRTHPAVLKGVLVNCYVHRLSFSSISAGGSVALHGQCSVKFWACVVAGYYRPFVSRASVI
jgi:hypothetical protein